MQYKYISSHAVKNQCALAKTCKSITPKNEK